MEEINKQGFQINCFYRINQEIRETAGYIEKEGAIGFAILEPNAFDKLCRETGIGVLAPEQEQSRRLTRLTEYEDMVCCVLQIPMQREGLKKYASFYLLVRKNGLLIVVKNEDARKLAEGFSISSPAGKNKLAKLIHDFLEYLIKGDLLFLEEIENRITNLEEGVLNEDQEDFNHKMIRIRKELMYLHNYYDQFLDLVSGLEENENEFFENTRCFKHLSERITRLHDYTQMLREYSMQVREIYQMQIDVRQNKIMKLLTGVATIFMPLTLITGWFGMNFAHMPELRFQYSYPILIAVCLVIVIVLIRYFKKKKYF